MASEKTVGIGYEGMFAGNLLQGLSVRGWLGRFGLEGSLWEGNAKVKSDTLLSTGDTDVTVWLLNGKVMFAPIVREHSKFYVGVEGGWANVDFNASGKENDASADAWFVGPLFGVEFHFQELPELGFNWEVGYRFASFSGEAGDAADNDLDINLNGIWVTLGVHYYFW